MIPVIVLFAMTGVCSAQSSLNEQVKGGMKECNVYFYLYNKDSANSIVKKKIFRTKYDKNGYRSEEEQYNDLGSIESKIYYTFDDSGRMLDLTSCQGESKINTRNVYKYDQAGNLIEEYSCGENSKIIEKHRYTFDSLNIRISEENVYFNEDTTLKLGEIIQYNQKSQIIEKLSFQDFQLNKAVKITYTYDIYGRRTEESKYFTEGDSTQKINYKYDSNGNPTQEFQLLSYGLINYQTLYKYDDKLNKTEEASYKGNGELIYRREYNYDGEKNRTEFREYGADNKLKLRTTYKYENRRVIEERTTIGHDSVIFYETHKFDSRGLILEQTTRDETGKITNKVSNKYDDRENLTDEIKYNADGLPLKRKVRAYDENNNLIEEKNYYGLDSLQNIISVKYNQRGQIIEKINNFAGGTETIKNKFTYDEYWNILTEEHYLNDNLNGRSEYIYSK